MPDKIADELRKLRSEVERLGALVDGLNSSVTDVIAGRLPIHTTPFVPEKRPRPRKVATIPKRMKRS